MFIISCDKNIIPKRTILYPINHKMAVQIHENDRKAMIVHLGAIHTRG